MSAEVKQPARTPLQHAAAVVVEKRIATVKVLIHYLEITPVEACDLLEQLEAHGVVSIPQGRAGRTVLIEDVYFLPAELQGGAR